MLRRWCGVTQEEMAQTIGVDLTTLWRWESGSAIVHKTMFGKIAAAHRMTLSELMAAHKPANHKAASIGTQWGRATASKRMGAASNWPREANNRSSNRVVATPNAACPSETRRSDFEDSFFDLLYRGSYSRIAPSVV